MLHNSVNVQLSDIKYIQKGKIAHFYVMYILITTKKNFFFKGSFL